MALVPPKPRRQANDVDINLVIGGKSLGQRIADEAPSKMKGCRIIAASKQLSPHPDPLPGRERELSVELGWRAMLTLMLLAAVPDQALLEKLGARALQLEAFANASRVTVDIVAEKLDAEGAVIKTTHTALRVGRKDGKPERKLLTFIEAGKDITEAKRAELEQEPRKPATVKSPFHPDQRAKYQFAVLAPPADKPALMRLGFQPSGEKHEELYMGDATVDPETGDVLSLSLRPSKNPTFVQSLAIEASLDAVTPAGRAMSRLTIKGVAGALFFKERFRVVTTFADYEPP